jgi:predicted RNA-binding protein
MCMATVWFKKDKKAEEILNEVAEIKIQGKNVVLSSLFGKNKTIEARIEEIDFLNSKVWLAPNNITKEE